MILCDICGKAMSVDPEGRIPFIYVSGWNTKHACPGCKYEWMKTKERVAENCRRQQWDAEANAWREFLETKKPEGKPE